MKERVKFIKITEEHYIFRAGDIKYIFTIVGEVLEIETIYISEISNLQDIKRKVYLPKELFVTFLQTFADEREAERVLKEIRKGGWV